jgi:prophage regulatory protein
MKALRWQKIHELTGISRTTVWRLETDGKFPRRRRLTGNAVAWIEEEILEWLNSREVGMGQAPGNRKERAQGRDGKRGGVQK